MLVITERNYSYCVYSFTNGVTKLGTVFIYIRPTDVTPTRSAPVTCARLKPT